MCPQINMLRDKLEINYFSNDPFKIDCTVCHSFVDELQQRLHAEIKNKTMKKQGCCLSCQDGAVQTKYLLLQTIENKSVKEKLLNNLNAAKEIGR